MTSLKVEPWTGDLQARCQRYLLKTDMAGGILKKGMEVWALHRIRIYVPLKAILEAHVENKDVTIEFKGKHLPADDIEMIHEAGDYVSVFHIDGQLFDRQFEIVLPKGSTDPSEPLIVPLQ